ncbi:Asp-tRNA(Asn)/Glu-tRNA(Gln) amidotransferase GatCAB subunit B, partial [bacterium]|nr:Asp-tRNA(Asn)/Glu-tRNA(Gln) amidotransferase GatCAB subunit B [bacterium]
KNMNSFRGVQKAISYEIERQKDVILSGEKIVQETRLWNDDKGSTFSMRSKEDAHDYRYFPEPDLVPMVVEQKYIDTLRENLPELPFPRMHRFIEQYGLPEYDADILTGDKAFADYYEQCASVCSEYKMISNWMLSDLIREAGARKISFADAPVTPKMLAEMISLISNGTISGKIAKIVFIEMFDSGKTPSKIIEEKGLVQISNPEELQKVISNVVAQHPAVVAEFKAGKEKSIGFLVGQIMKETKGKANPQLVNTLLREALG